MIQADEIEIERLRNWLRRNCHRADVRHCLSRGLDYYEAVSRAGLCADATSSDDLYRFLSDPSVIEARRRTFVEPTL
ncbi:MAG: hypothetical protein L6Q92_11195 [Phycisphaerae bacterium]|nr:hypothetical protein [Phycisphaerae bacterium]